jgi:hypothetical protein
VRSKDKTQGREALDQALATGLREPFAQEAQRTIRELDQK